MQIELSQDEVQTLQDALEAWERDASTGNMMASLFGASEKAETVTRERKIKSTMLRARLMQAALQTVTGA